MSAPSDPWGGGCGKTDDSTTQEGIANTMNLNRHRNLC